MRSSDSICKRGKTVVMCDTTSVSPHSRLSAGIHHNVQSLHWHCLMMQLCMQGGNDYEIFMSSKTKGHSVISPKDTQLQCTEIFISPMQQSIATAAAPAATS